MVQIFKCLIRKNSGDHEAKARKTENPKPEQEQEGMSQHRDRPPTHGILNNLEGGVLCYETI
jgi:hypothetical protein